RAGRHQRMAAAQPAAALAERPARPLAARAHFPRALAALRPRPRLGAAAPRAARLRRVSFPARGAGVGSPAGQGNHRVEGSVAAPCAGSAGAPAARSSTRLVGLFGRPDAGRTWFTRGLLARRARLANRVVFGEGELAVAVAVGPVEPHGHRLVPRPPPLP